MIASALSMGSGAYLAAKSEREIYHAEMAREREAIRMNGPEARELLSLYYQVKGLPEADADHMVNHIASDPEQMLRALAGERLGTSEEALVEPLGLRHFWRSLHGRRRHDPDHSVFLHAVVFPPLPPQPSSRLPRILPSALPRASSPSAPGGLRASK